jgi:putative Mg2+ transporter-C (MgtC) family protein
MRLVLGAAVGSLIGWQRQMHGSPAGLRTHILVCLGATLLTSIDMLHADFQGKLAAAVVTGIGFLGAGTIIHSEKSDNVRGLTTAASVWVTAGIGIALGSGGSSTYLGVFVALLVLATLSVVYRVEGLALRHRRNRRLVTIINRPSGVSVDDIVARVVDRLTAAGAAVEGISKDKQSFETNDTVIHYQIRLPDGFDPAAVLQACTSDANVVQANWDI